MMSNISAVLHGKLDLRVEDTEMPIPKKNEVVVEMKRCGICGTDMHMWQEGRCGPLVIDERNPLVIGHESSGVVHAVGDDVISLQIGDRVALELGLPCRKCSFCKDGKYNLCKPFSYGALTRFHSYPADFCHRLPDSVSFDEAALAEPLAVAVRAVRRAGVTLGSSVLVCGAGCIGLCVTMVAKAAGAAKICITDISAERLQLAKELGATHVHLVNTETTPQNRGRAICEQLGEMPGFSIECTGVESSLQSAIYATKTGGTVAPVGLGDDNLAVPVVNATLRELDIKGVFSYCNDYPPAIALISSDKVRPTPMITHRFPLSDVLQAFHFTQAKHNGAIKVMIDCDK